MSLKTALLKTFGFSSADDDDYDELSDLPSGLPVNHQISRDSVATARTSGHTPATQSQSAPVSDDNMTEFELPLEVFDGLLQVFNDSQPDFIKKCLDQESQRRYLYESLDASFKEYMAGYCEKARIAADRRQQQLLHKIDSESSELRQQLEAARKSLAEAKEQSMSAVRQRRAFNERIRDLEQQLETEKAEKEQYSLETKSLLNKLKVVQVQGVSDTESAEEITRLRNSLDEMQARLVAAETEKQELSRQLTEKQKALETALADLEKAKETTKPVVVKFDDVKAENTNRENKPQTENTNPANDVKPSRKIRKQRRPQKPPTVSISAIDDSLDTTEWLIPTPPAGSAKSLSSVTDSEFGYHEPPRDEPPVNDAQLSLFD